MFGEERIHLHLLYIGDDGVVGRVAGNEPLLYRVNKLPEITGGIITWKKFSGKMQKNFPDSLDKSINMF